MRPDASGPAGGGILSREVSALREDRAMASTDSREHVRFLVFSASLRRGSLNSRLAVLAANVIEANGAEAELACTRICSP